MYKKLKKEVYEANMLLPKHNLVMLTWGNVSGVDREKNVFAIKPSGVSYDELTPDMMVICDLDGNKIEGNLNPSSDTATHACLYRAFEKIGGVTHTHSQNATAFAQADCEIPALGTTHADYFYGAIPVTRKLTDEEINGDYELETGNVIVERFENLDYSAICAVLVCAHAPFVWGESAYKSVENSLVLEEIAQMALKTKLLNPSIQKMQSSLLNKHYLRKHGKNAYYGQ